MSSFRGDIERERERVAAAPRALGTPLSESVRESERVRECVRLTASKDIVEIHLPREMAQIVL